MSKQASLRSNQSARLCPYQWYCPYAPLHHVQRSHRMRHHHPRRPVLNQMAARPVTVCRFAIVYSSYNYHEPRKISNAPYFSVYETYSFLKTLVTAMNLLYLCLRLLRYLLSLAKWWETCVVFTSLCVITDAERPCGNHRPWRTRSLNFCLQLAHTGSAEHTYLIICLLF